MIGRLIRWLWRSAITGRFISRKEAEAHPEEQRPRAFPRFRRRSMSLVALLVGWGVPARFAKPLLIVGGIVAVAARTTSSHAVKIHDHNVDQAARARSCVPRAATTGQTAREACHRLPTFWPTKVSRK
jgi:hypothetical protein